MYNPDLDGIDHINVYSKAKTELGRLLTNFAHTPFTHPEFGNFKCVEGFWYYIISQDDRLKNTNGWESKQLGRTLTEKREHPSKEELLIAYKAKLESTPNLKRLLNENSLPLVHYYVYAGKVVPAKQWEWTATLWEELKDV